MWHSFPFSEVEPVFTCNDMFACSAGFLYSQVNSYDFRYKLSMKAGTICSLNVNNSHHPARACWLHSSEGWALSDEWVNAARYTACPSFSEAHTKSAKGKNSSYRQSKWVLRLACPSSACQGASPGIPLSELLDFHWLPGPTQTTLLLHRLPEST